MTALASEESTLIPRTHERRVAVVTGASGGLGRAICRGLAAAGATVVGVDLKAAADTAADTRAAGGEWLGIVADVTSPEDTHDVADRVVATYGRCDILVNNAGVADICGWDELSYELWQQVLRVNLDGQFLMAKALVPAMREHGYGRIVNISSTSVAMPVDNFIAYRVSKMGVIGLTRALASLGADGITANAVSPSLTPTGMTDGRVPDEVFEMIRQGQNIKRIARPDDLVPTILFLTGEGSYWVTGQAFAADGGGSFNLP